MLYNVQYKNQIPIFYFTTVAFEYKTGFIQSDLLQYFNMHTLRSFIWQLRYPTTSKMHAHA